jgi:hypothetical protein
MDLFFKVVGIVAVCVIGGCGLLAIVGGSAANKVSQDINRQQAEPANVTLAEFNQIQVGMTYRQVADIVGSEGELTGQNQFGNMTTETYNWSNKPFGGMFCMFQNGKLTQKNQMSLK